MKGKKHSKETKEQMSKDRKGSIPWNKGKKIGAVPIEIREKISKTLKARYS